MKLDDEARGARYGYRSVFRWSKPSRLAWLPDRLVIPRLLAKDKVDVYHCNDVVSIGFGRRTRTVATVHDVIPLLFWKEMSSTMPVDYRFALREGLRRAARCDALITDSECSKTDLSQRLKIPVERIRVAFPGCNPTFQPREREKARGRLRERFAIDAPFLLYVGGSDYRKNLPVLVEAFSEILKTGYQGSLVMVGETFHWDIEEIRRLRALISRVGVGDRVIYPGYVEDDELPDFYAACDMFVFPSLYEGFGLPVLEALACGAVALVSRASSVPEVAGDAAEYFDPRSVASIVEVFRALYGDEERRQELRSKGPAQARKFSWDDTARTVLALYDELFQSASTRGQ